MCLSTRMLLGRITAGAIILFVSVLASGQQSIDRSNLASPSPTPALTALPNEFEVTFDKAGPRIPCICETTGYVGMTSADEEIQLQVSVTTNSAVRSPLTYRYEISGGQIVGQGPTVVWDFSGLIPGDFKITVNITDEKDTVGKTVSKTVQLSAPQSCDCPYICPRNMIRSNMKSVRPGGVVKFNVVVLGGDLDRSQLNYRWKILHGRIKSGQGTPEVTAVVEPDTTEPEAVAIVEIGGMDPRANCPNMATGSVSIGKQAIVEKSGAVALVLDEKRLVLACPPGVKGCSQSSPDMVVDVLLESANSRRNFEYLYSVTGGKIIGSGRRIKWDLSNIAPGSYQIRALALRNGKPFGEEVSEAVTIESEICICDPVCPEVSISEPEFKIRAGDKLIVSASIKGGAGDRAIMYNWTTSSGEIISGQGSPFVRVKTPRASDIRRLVVTLNVGGFDPFANCLTRVSQEISIEPNR